MQSSFDFTAAESHRENNSESSQHHDSNLPHFAKQDQRVYEMLLNGARLTTTEALRFGIGDLRRRCKTIRDAHRDHPNEVRDVDDEWALDAAGQKTRFKIYFIKQPQQDEQEN